MNEIFENIDELTASFLSTINDAKHTGANPHEVLLALASSMMHVVFHSSTSVDRARQALELAIENYKDKIPNARN